MAKNSRLTIHGRLYLKFVHFFLPNQWTPLHWAAGSGHTDTVQYLAENEAEINIKDIIEVGK